MQHQVTANDTLTAVVSSVCLSVCPPAVLQPRLAGFGVRGPKLGQVSVLIGRRRVTRGGEGGGGVSVSLDSVRFHRLAAFHSDRTVESLVHVVIRLSTGSEGYH